MRPNWNWQAISSHWAVLIWLDFNALLDQPGPGENFGDTDILRLMSQ